MTKQQMEAAQAHADDSEMLYNSSILRSDLRLVLAEVKELWEYIDGCKALLVEAGVENHGLLAVVAKRAADLIKRCDSGRCGE